MSYLCGGTGHELLLMHGLGTYSAIWLPLMDRLAGSFSYMAPDLPGHGFSQKVPETFSMDHLSNLILEFIRKMGMSNPLIIAHSFSCHPVMNASPSLTVAGLVLLSPFLGKKENLPWLKPVLSPALGTFFRLKVNPDGIRKIFRELVYEPDSLDEKMIGRILEPLDDDEKREGLLRLSCLIEDEFAGQISGMRGASMPILFVAGRDDPLCDGKVLRSLSDQYGAKLLIIDRCGHFPQIERPVLLSQHLLGFPLPARPRWVPKCSHDSR